MKRLVSPVCAGICALLLASAGWAQGPYQPSNIYHGPYMPPGPSQGPCCNPPWSVPPLTPGQGTPGTLPSTTPGTPGGQGTGDQGTGQQGTNQQGTGDQSANNADNSQTQPTERGGEVAGNYDGPMFGDLIVPSPSFQSGVSPQLSQLANLGSAGTAATGGAHGIGGGGGFAAATFPFHAAIKIGENELPKPVDRVYITYNYYSDVAASGLAYGGTGAQVNRQLVGGEKTFLSGNASVGVRMPIFQTFGTNSVTSYQLGETSLIFKYAFYNNRQTGDVLSAGMVFSFPTGRSLDVPGQSSVNSTYFQPWVGGIFHIENVYFLDFTSVAVPTDARDISFFFESFGVGYLIYRNSDPSALLRGIVPDAEFHANIPLNHQGLQSTPIGFPTTVDFTGGCLFFLGRSILGLAAGTPMTGPKPYGFEAIASLNYFF